MAMIVPSNVQLTVGQMSCSVLESAIKQLDVVFQTNVLNPMAYLVMTGTHVLPSVKLNARAQKHFAREAKISMDVRMQELV